MNPHRRLVQRFDKYAKEVKHCAKMVHAKISRKSIHDLRIAVRRTRSVLWIVRHSGNGPRLKKLDRDLHKLGRALGRSRELDVAIKDAGSYHINTIKLKKHRTESRQFVFHLVSRKRQRRIEKESGNALKAIQKSKNLAFDNGLGELRDELAQWKRRRFRRKSEIHRFRIAVKRLRYILEALGKNVRPLIDLQETLGKIHDLEVLQNLTRPHSAVKSDLAMLRAKANQLISAWFRKDLHASLPVIGAVGRVK